MSGPLGSQQWMYSTGFYPYEIDNSARLGTNSYFQRTPSSAGNRKTWTWSGWVKRGQIGVSGVYPHFGISAGTANNSSVARSEMMFTPSSNIVIGFNPSGSSWYESTTNAVFRDPSAWYHIVVSVDMTQATDTNRLKLWVNGALQTFSSYSVPAQNTDLTINNTTQHAIGDYVAGLSTSSYNFDGYMAEVNFIDGQALDPTSFGQFKSGVWIPKSYSGTYGTNGFYLDFATRATDPIDASGNGNNWGSVNVVSTDWMLDSPTNNFATLNSVSGVGTLSEGNLQQDGVTSAWATRESTIAVSSGKWYFEARTLDGTTTQGQIFGVSRTNSFASGYYIGITADSYSYYLFDGTKLNSGSATAYGASFGDGDIVGVALNLDDGELTFYKNGVSQGVAFSSLPSGIYYLMGSAYGSATYRINFGQDSSFAGATTAQGNTDANGIGDFYYAPPAGYLALCTANLPDPAINPAQDDVPADYFNTVLWTGDGTTSRDITGVGFQPDWVWYKKRSAAFDHNLFDAVRGAGKSLESSSTAAEFTSSDRLNGFVSDGFNVGNNSGVNASSATYVAWNWKADGSGASNTDGTITSTVSANQKAGFSIVSYTGNGSNATVGHGLSSTPEMIIFKNRTSSGNSWVVYSSELGATKYLLLDSAGSAGTYNHFQNTAPTSSVAYITGGATAVNANTNNYIAYCFHSVEGYSKFGSYTGNGSTDGPFVYTGFRPAFVLMKDTGSAEQWQIVDSARDTYNVVDSALFPNSSNAEGTSATIHRDFLSNGFKVRTSDTSQNASGRTYIYMAFAEMPFKYANAR